MKFVFESLLRYSEALARREELALTALSQQVAQTRVQLEAWHALGQKRRDSTRQQLEKGFAAIELHLAEDCVQIANEKIAVLAQEIARLEKSREQLRQKLLATRRRVEALLTLRKRQQERFAREQLRRQQQMLDETFLIRRHRTRQ